MHVENEKKNKQRSFGTISVFVNAIEFIHLATEKKRFQNNNKYTQFIGVDKIQHMKSTKQENTQNTQNTFWRLYKMYSLFKFFFSFFTIHTNGQFSIVSHLVMKYIIWKVNVDTSCLKFPEYECAHAYRPPNVCQVFVILYRKLVLVCVFHTVPSSELKRRGGEVIFFPFTKIM